MNPIRSMGMTQHVCGLAAGFIWNDCFERRDAGNQVIGWHLSTVVVYSNQGRRHDLRRWDLRSRMRGIFLGPSAGRRGNSYMYPNSRNRCGEEYIPVTPGGYQRVSGAQQVTDRRCMIRFRWECRFDFDNVIRLGHLIAVGRIHRLRVATSQSSTQSNAA